MKTVYKCQREGCGFESESEREAALHRGTDEAPGHGEVGTFVTVG